MEKNEIQNRKRKENKRTSLYLRYEFLTAVNMPRGLLDFSVSPCRHVRRYERLGRTYTLHILA